ncbi:MAG: spore coat protein [Firmicutes bacterium]|nr:spore coat protein [Bacillota bacterium]
MEQSNKPKVGKTTTPATTSPKAKSGGTPGKSTGSSNGKNTSQSSSQSKNAKSGFGRNTAASAAGQSKSSVKSSPTTQKSAAGNVGKTPAWSKPSSKAAVKMETSSELCQLKDFDIASDVLGGQKALLKLYGTALCETDCPALRNIINNQLSEVAVDQFDTFMYMNQRGMYPTEQAPANKVKQAVTKYNQKAVFKKK